MLKPLICSLCLLPAVVLAQQVTTGNCLLHGVVADSTGAIIPGAHVSLLLTGATTPLETTAGPDGTYTLSAPAGTQGAFRVSAPGFAAYSRPVALPQAKSSVLNIKLLIEAQSETVNVSDTADRTDPNNNGNRFDLKGKQLQQLPSDPAELQQQLQGLTGGDSPQVYINGFTGGKIPPKDTIREIRINQNPFSAQNDISPVQGRLEIFTKPGGDKVHGSLFTYGSDSALNSQNPFSPNLPPYYETYSAGDLGGPLTKHSGYFLAGSRHSYQGSTIVNALIPAGPYAAAVAAPNTSTDFSSRYDASLGASSTVTALYSFNQSNQTNSGVGQLTLQSQGLDTYSTTHTLQVGNSQIISPKIVNDTRFQYIRSRTHQSPASTGVSLLVQGAFNGGGNPAGAARDNLDRYELQNYLSASEGKHYLSIGARLRVVRDANESFANYNGSYVFPSLTAYQLTTANVAACQAGLPSCQTDAQLRAAGGGASLFTLSSGIASIKVALADVGAYVQDDIKLRPNFTLSPGLRFESQSGISNHADFAPRLGLTWNVLAKGKPGPYTVRAGAGIFYQRFAYTGLAIAERQNGMTQQQYFIENPSFYPNVPAPSALSATTASSITTISPRFHAPYLIATNVGVDRRFGSFGTLSIDYFFHRGIHTQLQRNINAPLPDGTRPFGGQQNIYEYQSEGFSNWNRAGLTYNINYKKLFLFSFANLAVNHNDSDGGFPSNQYDLGADYGRSTQDTRYNLGFGGGVPLMFGFRSFTFFRAHSGNPFNITLGQDLNGDSQFNDRPTFATDLTRPSVVRTRYGSFDTAPVAGQTVIPRNYAVGPRFAVGYFTLERVFTFGSVLPAPPDAPAVKLAPGAKPPKPDRRYEMNLSISLENVFNHQNLATPVGVLPYSANPGQTLQQTLDTSLFGRSTGLANGNSSGNRAVDMQLYFHF